ncbi:MAG TPA: sialidase family protein [Gemmatimonadaceae bacterium]|nr:sialidase family protein [Gemmatimonadaceae bacterium]
MPSRLSLLALAVFVAACDRSPVDWEEPRQITGAAASDARLLLDSAGRVLFLPRGIAPIVLPAGACPESRVFARVGVDDWYVAWWMPRPDSSAEIQVSRTIDGGRTWSAPVVADRRDRSTRGCRRLAPAIYADSASGYVHLSYFMEPEQGSGVWYTHSQERGEVWHEPVGVVFGDDPARSGVGANGQTVAVAYEHPNAADARVGLALSATEGHLFERHMVLSGANMAASEPRVFVRDRAIAVSWTTRARGTDASAPANTVVVMGELAR